MEHPDNLSFKKLSISNNNNTKSWHWDSDNPSLPKEKVDSFKLIPAGIKDVEKVIDFYHHHPVPNKKIKEVQVIYNPNMNRGFMSQLGMLQKRDGKTAFSYKWNKESDNEWRKKVYEQCLELAKPYQDSDFPAVKILPLWHGTKSDVLNDIYETGFANLATTDAGFFGRGIYFTPQAEYAYRVYSKGGLIFSWVAFYSPYPVIKNDINHLVGGGNYQNYDAHFAPVVPASLSNPQETAYYPCSEPTEKAVYHELVVFQSLQALPRYQIELGSEAENILKTIIVSMPGYEEFQKGYQFYLKSEWLKSLPYFLKAADKNYPPAFIYLWRYYLMSGFIGAINPIEEKKMHTRIVENIEWFQRRATTNQPEAQNDLAICYVNGTGVQQDKKKAVELYQKAAEQGLTQAQCNLGSHYEKGTGANQDYEKAIGCYLQAANQGFAFAQYLLGKCFYDGKGLSQDYKQAVQLFLKAANQELAHAQNKLGDCYEYGKGVEQDFKKAAEYYSLAAKQGLAQAQYHLGVCYYTGQGVSKDLTKATELYTLAANQGDAKAQCYLAFCYYTGQGVSKDLNKAFELYTLATNQGLAPAQNNLGVCYYTGQGVSKDLSKAVELYTLAANQGLAQAQYHLGLCYYNAQGVSKDLNKALVWYQKAAEQGNEDAKQQIQQLLEQHPDLKKMMGNSDNFFKPIDDDKPKAEISCFKPQ